MKQTDPQFKLRLPALLKERLDQVAEEHEKTLTAEIVQRLEESFNLLAPEESNKLELELAMQRAETFKERNTALKYSFALMVVAERLPPGTFSDNPIIENLLAEARKDKVLKVESALLQMGQDAKQAHEDFKDGVAAGRIKVNSEEETAEREAQESEAIEVTVRGKKRTLISGPNGLVEIPAKPAK